MGFEGGDLGHSIYLIREIFMAKQPLGRFRSFQKLSWVSRVATYR